MVEYVCIYRQNLALKDLQGLICHKTQTTNQPTNQLTSRKKTNKKQNKKVQQRKIMILKDG